MDELRSFDWDSFKALQNIALGRMSFDSAADVFNDPRRIDVEDDPFDYGEERRITIGRICTVVYTMRDETTWIISARPAHRKERRRYG